MILMNLFSGQQWRNRPREQTHGHGEGRREQGRCMERVTEICVCVLVAQSCPTLCDPMDCSMPGFPVHQQLLKVAQTHVHQVSDAIHKEE